MLNTSILFQKLDEELSWRRKELSLVNKQIPSKSNSLQIALVRAAVPILYAHWEGFVKSITEAYLEFISNKQLKHSELKSSFLTLSILKKVNSYELNEYRQKVEFVEELINEFEKASFIPIKNVISTKSNLGYENFEAIIFILNLEISTFSRYKDLINDIVATRNHIAHGHYLKIDYVTYVGFHDEIVSVMTQLKTLIENSVILEGYKDTNRFAS